MAPLVPASAVSRSSSLTALSLSDEGSDGRKRLGAGEVDVLVARLYKPEALLRKTEEDCHRKWRRRPRDYDAADDPHLRAWWHRQRVVGSAPPRASTAPLPLTADGRPASRASSRPPPSRPRPALTAIASSILGPDRCDAFEEWLRVTAPTNHPSTGDPGDCVLANLDWGCLVSCAGVSKGWRSCAVSVLRRRLQEQGHVCAPSNRQAIRAAGRLAASSRRHRVPNTCGALVPVGAGPLEEQQPGKPAGVSRSDLTTLRVLIDPPVHFQSMVHRLQIDMSPYDLRWVPKATAENISAIRPMLTTLSDLPMGPDEVSEWRQKRGKREVRCRGAPAAADTSRPRSAGESVRRESRKPDPGCKVHPEAVITSPRSTLCLLRAGVDPRELLPADLSKYRKVADLEGAPPHIAERRHRHHERNRQRALSGLLAAYADMCGRVSLDRFVILLQRYSPESNPDQALLADRVEVTDDDSLPPSGDELAVSKARRRILGNVRQCFRRAMGSDAMAATDELRAEMQGNDTLRGAMARARKRGSDPEAKAVAGILDRIRCPGRVSWEDVEGVTEDRDPTRFELLQAKHQLHLEQSLDRIEGHCLRSLKIDLEKKRIIDRKRCRFEHHMRQFEEEREREKQRRQDQARRRAENRAMLVQANKEREAARQKNLLDRFGAEDARQERTAAQRQMQLQVRREETRLIVEDKIRGIQRQAKVDQWNKLHIVDRIRRKHDRAVSGEAALKGLVRETSWARENMQRENTSTLQLLRRPPPSIGAILAAHSSAQ
eukprot:TRINITY_DN26753_c0_g1_i1.p1 TRINITY_DN26753_c0_g1~~TRINITY_DN26753_c0_g1_i1.p1  ORF type:complete len:799 (+),score=216.31 TRINITY_DN26753_c0_g1_i1:75-2399(+)